MYHSYLSLSYLLYLAYGKRNLNNIFYVQKKIVIIMPYLHYIVHTDIIFKELNILNTEKQITGIRWSL